MTMPNTRICFEFTDVMIDMAARRYGFVDMVQEHAADGTPLVTETGAPKMIPNTADKAIFVRDKLEEHYLGELRQEETRRLLRESRARISSQVEADIEANRMAPIARHRPSSSAGERSHQRENARPPAQAAARPAPTQVRRLVRSVLLA